MRIWVATCLGMALMLQPSMSFAGIFESLVSPGPVVESHAEVEADCDKCHSAFEKDRQNELCVACHEDVGKDILRQRGFHGGTPRVAGTDCKHCHTDHKGRDADIVRLDPDTFDHALTEFPLMGSHAGVACAGCHAPEEKYRDAPSQCVDCHKADEPHKGRLGTECATCHDENRWQDASFDHDTTDFPLKGKHVETRCEQCHVNDRYENTATACIACHGLDDVHAGRHGERCDTCHSPAGWNESAFDHDRETDFPLVGRHRVTRCDACHSGDFHDDTKGKTCFACHEKDDEHRGRNGEKCAECHSPRGWVKLDFDHARDTEFVLRGKHAEIVCESCHTGHTFDQKLETSCYACHRFQDSHQGALGQDCAECHVETGWSKTRFNHDTDTDFSLRGAHKEVLCRACHTAEVKRKKLETACYDCHAEDDVHKGQQGERCDSCHNEQDWGGKVFFDHDLTKFPLIGLHAVAPCEECHLSAAYKDTSSACADCHENDDEHRRRLGPYCGRCHNPNGWALWSFDHDRQTDYPLEGAHQGLACISCHTVPVKGEIELSTTCGNCHRRDDPHRGSFGAKCDRCHVTERFDLIRMR